MAIKTGEKMVATDITDLTFFPKGTILTFSSEAWNGTSSAFKNIWKICDGTDSRTPNLTNQFLRGGASSGTTGGGSITIGSGNLPAHTHAIGSHTHTFTPSGSIVSGGGEHTHSKSDVDDPGHTHAMYSNSVNNATGSGARLGTSNQNFSTQRAVTDISIKSSGTHSHNFTGVEGTSDVGSGNTGNNTTTGTAISVVPSFYTVIYIMKVA